MMLRRSGMMTACAAVLFFGTVPAGATDATAVPDQSGTAPPPASASPADSGTSAPAASTANLAATQTHATTSVLTDLKVYPSF
jgi:hypothetical protein